ATEYVIPLGAGRPLPPMPWTNVVANETFGFLATESGGGYTWSRNSREHRLTPWTNDPIADPWGEALHVRDDESGASWSPLADAEVAHGFGYSRWRRTSEDVDQETTLFVAGRDPMKVARVRLTNRRATARRLSLFAYWRLVLGVLPGDATIVTSVDAESGALFATNPGPGDFAGSVVFAAAVPPAGRGPVAWTADRAAFVGPGRTARAPIAVEAGGALDGCTGTGLDPCAALQVPIDIPPGATVDCAFLFGEAAA